MKQIDLNSDLGESFGAYTIGNDSEVLRWVSSANIACGMHAGDPFVMHRTVRLALERGAAIGAHPGLMDLPGFGRRTIPTKPEEAYDLVAYQLGALSAFVKAEGGRLQHVKPHGALYNMAAKDPALAEAIAGAVYDVDPSLVLYGLAGSCLIRARKRRDWPQPVRSSRTAPIRMTARSRRGRSPAPSSLTTRPPFLRCSA